MKTTASPDYWNQKLYIERGYVVIDPDGWDRRDPDSWDKHITWEEFLIRVAHSTLGPIPYRIPQ